ncbi:hypothetical protein LEP1GSC132_0613 [Leptospira kirschneri str. 200803703]|nr:hypothetical protein LEP1GSC132_0613 [Leptospira kirschneri str. 200803703]
MSTSSSNLETTSKWLNWKWQIQNRIKTRTHLSEFLELSEKEILSFETCSQFFEFSVTPYYLSLADTKDPNCPIRLQIVPHQEELIRSGFEKQDPLSEKTRLHYEFSNKSHFVQSVRQSKAI